MKAISIRQPWAHAILYLGKDIENRSYRTKHRGPILLHSALQLSETWKGNIPENILFGGIVGMANLVDVVDFHSSKWYIKGQFGWVLKDVKPLTFYKCRGYPGLFNVDYPYF